MRKLDNYIGFSVFAGISIVLIVLVGLFTFFSFIDEIDDIGKHHYGVLQAIQYVILEIPRHVYELFPTATLLGTLIGLGMLANTSELNVMRAAGVSVLRITYAALKVGVLTTLITMLIGETIAPQSDQYAKNLRATAQSEQNKMVFLSRYGFWARDSDDFVNIRTILSGGYFGDIALYKFDKYHRLNTLLYAKKAFYKDKEWHLQEVEKIDISDSEIKRSYLKSSTWNAMLNPELIKIIVVNPDRLSILGLYHYIRYLQENGQRSADYELALWNRLSYPLIGMTMVFLAVPFIFGSLRSVSVGHRVLVGAFLGVGFYMLNQTVGHLGLVYNLNPALGALLPPITFLMIAIFLIRRVV